jgi:5-methylcytosine-specific restriction endonuclease McrA
MNTELVCELYTSGKSMRQIALLMNTNHKRISRILKGENIQTKKPLNKRGLKKFKCHREVIYNNMATHLRFDVDYQWLMQFEDFKKVQQLNICITDRGGRWTVTTEWYKEYITKFYNDPQFNNVYEKWKLSDFEFYKKPSIDHIIPKSKKGTNDLDNLQFLSWFENRCKNDMLQEDWNIVKKNIGDYFVP